MKIKIKAPTRIDLAGGTLDIWPLYILEEGVITLNMAIDRYVEVEVCTREDGKLLFISEDLGIKQLYNSFSEFNNRDKFSLTERIIRYYSPGTGITVKTSCKSLYGSGLGQSSSLNIALNMAMNILVSKGLTDEEIILTARDIESKVLHNPAGLQDYYPPVYGGIRVINLEIGRVFSSELNLDHSFLTDRMILVSTGKSRLSVKTNWDMVKSYLEKDHKIITEFSRIKNNAFNFKKALLNEDTKEIINIMDAEWDIRKGICSGFITSEMDRILDTARKVTRVSAHVCGAGGGGCMTIFLEDSNARNNVIDCLSELEGIQVLDYGISKKGYFKEVVN